MSSIMDYIEENSVNYEIDKKIDIHNLHEEWIRQSGLVGDYNKLLAQAEQNRDNIKKKLDVCKANMDEAKAKLELDIRKNPKTYDPSDSVKVTEGWVSATLLLNLKKDPECVKAANELTESQNALIDANYKVSVYNAGVKAIESRKSSLENEVLLWTRNYFSVPDLPRPLIEDYKNLRLAELDEKVSKVREKIQPSEKPEVTSSAGPIETGQSIRRRRITENA